jgi:hypothetical protein
MFLIPMFLILMCGLQLIRSRLEVAEQYLRRRNCRERDAMFPRSRLNQRRLPRAAVE